MYEIISKRLLADNIVLANVKAPWIARSAKPGQFLIVIIDEKGERIPLTICDMDQDEGIISIVWQTVGKSTTRMAELEVGDTFHDVVGPLGQASEFVHEDLNVLRNKKLLFVAGGVGTAPVYPQVKWLHERGCEPDVIIGTKTKNTLILENEMQAVAKNLYVCTDDGSYGFHGMVTAKIEQLVEQENKHYDEVIAIGPMIMMKFVCLQTKKYNLKTTVSLNTLMVDGTGMCGACRVSIGGKTKFTCVDGPEFDGHLVDFDEAMRRQRMYKASEGGKQVSTHSCHSHEPSQPVHTTFVAGEKPKHRVPVREQDPQVRNHNFEEVCLGYSEEEAVAEAMRCLNCKKPACVGSCPVNIKIPNFIQAVRNREFELAAHIIAEDSALPAVCGRVCPQETQCEGSCILGKRGEPVAIGKLERFVADWTREHHINVGQSAPANGHKVAVVGSGPAGLTCAGDLAKRGYEVTIYEALHETGGVLAYGIPEFRLPKKTVVAHEVENVKKLGVKIENNVIVGKSITIDEMLDDYHYDAVFIGSGAGLPKFMGIPGENLNGVLSANELLTRSNLMKAYDNHYDTPIFTGNIAVIVGGGNVAMDAARTAKRLGADTHVVYRRSEKELPARVEEVHHAKEEGIHFHLLSNPIEILANEQGEVRGIRCIEMELGEPDASGRRSPVEKPNSEFEIACDSVIMSLGTSPNPLIISTTKGLESGRRGGIVANEEGATTREGVFAGGDAVTGAATVILAMGAGKQAAAAIDKYIQNKK